MDTLAQKKKAITLPAVLALTATTTVIAVVATLVLAGGSQAGASEVDLTTETPSGDVLNASALLVDAEAALQEFATAENITLAPEPAQSLCFFVRDDEGYVSENLACGPGRLSHATAGTYFSLPLTFNVNADGVLGAIDPEGTFTQADFTGATLFRPDGVQPYPTDIFGSISLKTTDLPLRLWDTYTYAPDSESVTVVEREPLPGFDGPATVGPVTFADDVERSATVTDAYIVRSVADENGTEYSNESSDSVWVMVEMEAGFPGANTNDEYSMNSLAGAYIQGGGSGNVYVDFEDEGRTTRMMRVAVDDAGHPKMLLLRMISDAQSWGVDNMCGMPSWQGWTTSGETVDHEILNSTPEVHASYEEEMGHPFDPDKPFRSM